MIFNSSSCKINGKVIDCVRSNRVCVIEPHDEFITFAVNDIIHNIHISKIKNIGFHSKSRTVVVIVPEAKQVISMVFTKLSFARIRHWVSFKYEAYKELDTV